MTRLSSILITSAAAIGFAAVASSPAVAGPGSECADSALQGTECGTNSVAADDATAVGFNAVASGEASTAVGEASSATGLFAVAIGKASLADADNSTALGTLAMATGIGSTAIGAGAIAEGENSVAIGINANAIAPNSVALGANSVADQANTVSVGAVGDERRIVNVAAGIAPTDAVNFGQLTTTNDAVAAVQAVNTTQSGQITALQAADTAFQSQLNDLDFDLSRDRRNARAGTAAALAAAALPQAMGEGRTMISGGVGTYRGRGAFAIGASHRLSGGNAVFKVGVTYDSEESVGANGGVGFEF